MFFIFLRLLALTSVITATYTVPVLAPLAQAMTYVLWPVTVGCTLVCLFDRNGMARKMLDGRTYQRRWFYAPLNFGLWLTMIFAIAYSGRPALAAMSFFFMTAIDSVRHRVQELRAEQAQQDQPAAQVKCPGHR